MTPKTASIIAFSIQAAAAAAGLIPCVGIFGGFLVPISIIFAIIALILAIRDHLSLALPITALLTWIPALGINIALYFFWIAVLATSATHSLPKPH